MIQTPDALEPAAPRAAGTRERILDAAERLYAEHGVHQTSLRLITAEAKVNLAAINYHFQTKEQLLGAVLRRLMDPINQHRIELLDSFEAAARNKPVKLEALLRAFVLPVFEPRDSHCRYAPRLYGRLQSEPGDVIPKMFLPIVAPVLARFRPAFHRTLSNLTDAEIGWGIHFTLGALTHTLTSPHVLAALTMGSSANGNNSETVERLVAFCAAGFRASVRDKSVHGGA